MTAAILELVKTLLLDAITSIDSMIANAAEVLSGGGGVTDIWYQIVTLSNILKPFCNIVIAICLLIEIAQVAAKVDIIKWEHGLKLCVKMALAKVAIDVAPTFLRACYNQATLWINSLGAPSLSLGSLVSTTTIETLLDGVTGLGGAIGLLASCLLLIMAIKICGLVVQVIAYGRIFEIYVYLLVSPLPMAFFPLGNGNGDGISRITSRFIKSFIAVCLQGVMILVVMRIFSSICGTAIANAVAEAGTAGGSVGVTNLCYALLMGCVVLVMSVAKCGSWAKGIIDAM